jgi:hypothetical protein
MERSVESKIVVFPKAANCYYRQESQKTPVLSSGQRL